MCVYHLCVFLCVCAEGIFDNVNIEADKREKEKKPSHRKVSSILSYHPQGALESDVIIQGYGLKIGSGLFTKWEKKYFMLFPNRLDFGDSLQVHTYIYRSMYTSQYEPFTYYLHTTTTSTLYPLPLYYRL